VYTAAAVVKVKKVRKGNDHHTDLTDSARVEAQWKEIMHANS
jgi:hypothetical protein